jgi:hypothetical protein
MPARPDFSIITILAFHWMFENRSEIKKNPVIRQNDQTKSSLLASLGVLLLHQRWGAHAVCLSTPGRPGFPFVFHTLPHSFKAYGLKPPQPVNGLGRTAAEIFEQGGEVEFDWEG